MQVNIDAKTRLSELVAAAERGEEGSSRAEELRRCASCPSP
jgi:hypothetical protein